MANPTKNELKTALNACVDAAKPTGDPDVPMTTTELDAALDNVAKHSDTTHPDKAYPVGIKVKKDA